jgi:hydroxypyruvate isomerase
MNIEAGISSIHSRVPSALRGRLNRWHPGAGHLDFRSILNALFSTGYQGWVSGEFLPQPDVETAALRNIAHLRQIR